MYAYSQCVVLNHRNFGEADKLITIYSKDFGKITCIAKGIRRPTSRKSGHLEIGNWCKVYIAKGKNLDILTEVELKKAFGVENLENEKTNEIYHFLELVDTLTPTSQKNALVFKLLVTYLNRVKTEDNYCLLSSAFKVKLLKMLGFFSASQLSPSSAKNLLHQIETEEYENLKIQSDLDDKSYLKLSEFLDSIIEKLIDKKLKTIRFLNGQS